MNLTVSLRALAILGLFAATPLAAQAPPVAPADSPARQSAGASGQAAQADKFISTVMSPFCPGLTLETCPSADAETLRVSVRARFAAGEDRDAIEESLVAAFGEGVRGVPKARGMGLVLWALPPVAVGVSLIALVWWLRRQQVGQ